ncbi:MAG: biotin--[acetyl-CoA-carboxylase] ligase [Deltaproteobacteria bacterium]|nr:biotin--[acetyl-CoA-carboxylase] ligase [Deltaproteobacteria bacterium]
MIEKQTTAAQETPIPGKPSLSHPDPDGSGVLGKWSGLAQIFDETGSTMDEARSLAKSGAPHMSIVVARRQTKGRGRLARTWESRDGGLYFTLVTRPLLPVSKAHLVLFTASFALCTVLREKFGVNASVKWPNDLLAEGKKISGMLSELSAEGDEVSFLNIGIGVNVNNDPTAALAESTSLRLLLGREIDTMEVLKAFLDEFERGFARIEDKGVMARWKALSLTPGREVTISTTSITLTGTALDVDEDGALILRLSDGSVERVIHGDCFHREPAHES